MVTNQAPNCTEVGYIEESCSCNYTRTTTVPSLGGDKLVDDTATRAIFGLASGNINVLS